MLISVNKSARILSMWGSKLKYNPDVSMMHDDDDALVEGDPEEGPAHLDLGSDSDVLISLGAKPHQPLNATTSIQTNRP